MPPTPDWNKYIDAGAEFVALTRAQARRRAKELVSQGQLAQGQVQTFVDDLVEESRRRTDEMLDVVRIEIQRQVKTLGIATKEDLAKLEARLTGKPYKSAKPKSPKLAAGKLPSRKGGTTKAGTNLAASSPKKSGAKKSGAKKAGAAGSGAKKAGAKTASTKNAAKSSAPKSGAKKASPKNAGKSSATKTGAAKKAAS